jgi:hypothetical protein
VCRVAVAARAGVDADSAPLLCGET